MDNPAPLRRLPTTRWTRVVAAGEQGREALADFCRAYWLPVYAYIRRRGYDEDRASDLCQSYFARVIGAGTLAAADPARGRFRAFLLADLAHFLADSRDHERALKRGGGARIVPIDAEDRYRAEPVDTMTPERLFDRAWALSLLASVVERLGAEQAASGKSAAFERLKVVLTDGPRAVAHAEIARELGMTEGAVQVAAHRLKKRYKTLLIEAIAATLDDPAEVDDEIRSLFEALG